MGWLWIGFGFAVLWAIGMLLDRRARREMLAEFRAQDHPCYVCAFERFLQADGIPYRRQSHVCDEGRADVMPASGAEVVPVEREG